MTLPRPSMRYPLSSLLLCVIAFVPAACTDRPEPDTAAADAPLRPRTSAFLRDFASESYVVMTDAALRRRFLPPQPDDGAPRGDGERPRGGTALYAAAAPAVVIVRTADGHGTGFFVSADGTLVTNHHVIETGLSHRPGASFATVHMGQMSAEGVMRLAPQPVNAALIKIDPVNDLALLKVERPAGAPPVPHLKLAGTAPKPGLDCGIVGHPSSGMLWTYRPCQVSSIGDFPKDMVDLVLTRLSATGSERAEIEAFVKTRPPRRIMLSSAQANPGDSGGPIVDRNGALIGVTFAGPGNADEDKFTYHVHLDEVRRLLTAMPTSPIVLPPDPWYFGPRALLRDIDRDGRPDVLIGGSAGRDGSGQVEPEMLLFDLDNDTPAALLGGQPNFPALVRDRQWDFDLALDIQGSEHTSFYDTDGDGRVDLILTGDQDAPLSNASFTYDPAASRWRYAAAAGQRMISGAHFKNPRLGQRLDALARAMQ